MNSNSFFKKTKPNKHQENKKLALKLGIQTYHILTNDDEVCIPSLSRIFLAVPFVLRKGFQGKGNMIFETTIPSKKYIKLSLTIKL